MTGLRELPRKGHVCGDERAAVAGGEHAGDAAHQNPPTVTEA
jgi:hypothetical protein